ncbi:unnamed protein product [Effrenium voratum]|nr:unnamed protein product [Effrenium voratum]
MVWARIPLDVTEEELMDIADDIVQQQVPDQADLVVFKEHCEEASRQDARQRPTSACAPQGGGCMCGLEQADPELPWAPQQDAEKAVAPWEQAARLHAELRRRGGPAPLLTDFGDLQDDLVLLQSWAFELSEKQRSFLGL